MTTLHVVSTRSEDFSNSHPKYPGEDMGTSLHLSAMNEQGQKKIWSLQEETTIVKIHTFTPTTLSHV